MSQFTVEEQVKALKDTQESMGNFSEAEVAEIEARVATLSVDPQGNDFSLVLKCSTC